MHILNLILTVHPKSRYNNGDEKIKLLHTFSHTDTVYECIMKNEVSALCCDLGGYIKEYNLTNPDSIPPPTQFNQYTPNNKLHSLILTVRGKYVIGGSYGELYFMNKENGTLTDIHTYISGGSPHAAYQIAEVRIGILITVDYLSAYRHDIRNKKTSVELSHNMYYYTVIALKSNPGDLAIGGVTKSTSLGVVYIQHMDAALTLTTLDYVIIPEMFCVVTVIKEIKVGTILIGGDSYCPLCVWNYSAIPPQTHLCWDDFLHDNVYDIIQVTLSTLFSYK